MFRISILLSGLILLFGCANSDEPLLNEGSEAETVTEGYQFTEGPYWHSDGYLLFSDIPANKVYKWAPGTEAEAYLDSSGHSNALKEYHDGSILLAQHTGKVSKYSKEGGFETLADSYEGKRLNSPNDMTIHSNGTIFFTDPPYGVDEENRELNFSGVYKLTPQGELTLIYDEFNRPNGIVLSPNEKFLYVNDTETGDIMEFEVDSEGNVSSSSAFASVGAASEQGAADGMAIDQKGRLYTTGPGGLHIFEASGKKIQHVEIEHRLTNLAWGGKKLNDLYMTAPDRVLKLKFNTKGHQ